jgi:hypothetical protein
VKRDPEYESELQTELDRLRAENAVLKSDVRVGVGGKLSLKVGAKGGVSVYGLSRFPVTLYRSQWEKLLDYGDEIRKFMDENAAALKVKS